MTNLQNSKKAKLTFNLALPLLAHLTLAEPAWSYGVEFFDEISNLQNNIMTPYLARLHTVTSRWLCPIGDIYDLSCETVTSAPKPQFIKFLESKEQINGTEPLQVIDKHTHRMWLTNPHEPQEVPLSRLRNYAHSLEFYRGLSYTHHFWTNDPELIPETIALIELFSLPVIIHSISEIEDSFIQKDLFHKLFNDNLFSFASDIVRQELIVLFGGIYADIGIKQLVYLDHYFQHYDRIQCIRDGWIDTHFIAGPKGSDFFKKSLHLLTPLMQEVKERGLEIPTSHVHEFLEARTWQLVSAMEKEPYPAVGFIFAGTHYSTYGLGSWRGFVNDVTVSYLLDHPDEQ